MTRSEAGAPGLRRIGVLGDIHAEDALLRAAIARLGAEGAERLLAVGDLVDGPGDVAACVALLQHANALVVRGNHERWWLAGQMRSLPDATPLDALDDATRAYLAALPPTATVGTVAGSLLLCHGLGANDMSGVRPDDFGYALASNSELQALVEAGDHALVVNGHTHRRMVRRFGALCIVNAGTLYREHDPCFALLELDRARVRFFAIDPRTAAVAEAETVAL